MPDAEHRSPSGAIPGIEDWRRLVERTLERDFASLTSSTRDDIPIEPLYQRRRDARPLLGRGALPWTIVQSVDDPDPDRANAQAIADIEGGATGLSLCFDGSAASGGTGLPPTAEALGVALDGIDFAATHVRLEPHPQQLETVLRTKDLVLKTGVAPELVSVSFGLDLFLGRTPDGNRTPDRRVLAETFMTLRATRIFGWLAVLDARPYHEAGASEAQELAALLSTAVWWLHTLDDAGLSPEDALRHFDANLCVDRDLLLSLAKIRALRMLWARFVGLCSETPWNLEIHTQTSRRMLTRADPHGNLLRNTLSAFAAAVGGANSILVLPHTAALGVAEPDARALARNIQHLLMDEAHLARVADPGAGSGAIEALTDALAERAWAEFQAIEREGGIVASLRSGAFQARVAHARAALVDEVTRGKAPLVGSTLYAAGQVDVEKAVSVAGPAGLAPISLEALAKAAA